MCQSDATEQLSRLHNLPYPPLKDMLSIARQAFYTRILLPRRAGAPLTSFRPQFRSLISAFTCAFTHNVDQNILES